MSLADELLADLEDDEILDDVQSNSNSNELPDSEPSLESTAKQYTSIRTLATVIESEELERVMNEIKNRQSNDGKFVFGLTLFD